MSSNAKHALFPNKMTRIEKMLRHSAMDGYRLAVDRQGDTRIVLTAYDGSTSMTTEIFRDSIEEDLKSKSNRRIIVAHSVNRNAENEFYLTWTRMTADTDLKKLVHLEMKVCGQMNGRVSFEGQVPVIECDVPIKEIECADRK